MSLTTSVTRMTTAMRRVPPTALRHLSSAAPAAAESVDKEKRFVRIAGPASYSSSEDISVFLDQHGISVPRGNAAFLQGQSDVFQNHSIWMMETDSQQQAVDIASRITGRVLGLKLIRAAAVDRKLYDNLLSLPEQQQNRSTSLRRRMTIIAPSPEERGRTLLARNLQFHLHPRSLWSFFSAYDVVDVRHLRRSGVACIVFNSPEEACRALRERKNVPLARQYPISLKMHE